MLDKIICGTLTRPQYKNLCDVVGWWNGEKNYDCWDRYKKETAIQIKNGEIVGYCRLKYFKQSEDYQDYLFLYYDELMDKLEPTKTTRYAIWMEEPIKTLDCPHCGRTIIIGTPTLFERLKKWAKEITTDTLKSGK